ncbi:unnamed protein product [Ectocarpus sp. 4 AP-2014]
MVNGHGTKKAIERGERRKEGRGRKRGWRDTNTGRDPGCDNRGNRNRPLLGVPCGRMMALWRRRVGFTSSAIILLLLQQFRTLTGTPHLSTIGVEAHADGHVLGSVDKRHSHGNSTGLFSREWEAMYASGHVGCDLGRKRYYWRPCGLGSNIVHLLNAFVYALTVNKWSDVAVMSPPGTLKFLQCQGDQGQSLRGYHCFFRPMPHVCNFGTEKEWKNFMKRKGVSKEDLVEAPKVHWQRIRTRQAWRAQEEALKEYGVDTFGALSVMARLLWKNLTPWLQEDVRKALERPDLDVFRRKPFVGLHVRRGDKVAEGEAQKVETKEYLSAAARFFDSEASQDKQDIEAIWVASDDHNVVEEVRAIARQYFPNVVDEDIVWVSGGARGGAVTTHTKSEGYQGFVMVFADLKMLAASSVFVGTYTSNVSRLVALLREGIHGHARDSCISLDKTEFGLQY